jgi:hypothetical protein
VNTQESDERAYTIAGPLQRAVAERVAEHATAADNRLALLTDDRKVYVATIGFDADASVASVAIERVDLETDAVRLSYAETDQYKKGLVVYTWRADLGLEEGPLEFRAEARNAPGALRFRESDEPGLAFGWQLAEAVGWAREQPDEPFVEVH